MFLGKISQFLLLLISLVSITTSSAYAYLDPGTGSMILQATIAAIALGLATIKSWWYRVTAFFGNKDEVTHEMQDQQQDSSETTQQKNS